jgi:Thymidylate synthase
MEWMASSVNQCLVQAMDHLRFNGRVVGTRIGPSMELGPAFFTVRNPRDRCTFYRRFSVGFGISEAIWVLLGREDVHCLLPWNRRMVEFSDDGRTLAGAYGKRLRSGRGFDQLVAAIEELKVNPDSRQVFTEIWDANRDFPVSGPRSRDVSCSIGDFLLIREEKLNLTHVMRSNDLVWGAPYDMFVFSVIQEFLAGLLDCDVGVYCHVANIIQVYERHWSKMEEWARSGRENDWRTKGASKKLLDLRIAQRDVGNHVAFLNCFLDHAHACSVAETISHLRQFSVSNSYKHIVWVALAELCVRRREGEQARALLDEVGESQYTEALSRWAKANGAERGSAVSERVAGCQ